VWWDCAHVCVCVWLVLCLGVNSCHTLSCPQAELCKFLVQNSRTADLPVFALTLRVIFNLFNSMKEHLKVQLEVFFTSAHLFIADSKEAPSQQRELALESLLEFCREPAMMVDLYVNYDCDVACTNLFDTLCACLCRNAVPDGVRLNSLHVLALEGILAVRCLGLSCTSLCCLGRMCALQASPRTPGSTFPPL